MATTKCQHPAVKQKTLLLFGVVYSFGMWTKCLNKFTKLPTSPIPKVIQNSVVPQLPHPQKTHCNSLKYYDFF